jgi:hypothetical protein
MGRIISEPSMLRHSWQRTTAPEVQIRRQAMKRSLVLSVLFLCSIASAQGKYRPGQYPVNQNPRDYTMKVHISATHVRSCSLDYGPDYGCYEAVYVDAIFNGKKVELFGGVDKHQLQLIVPGDYWAMLPKRPLAGGSEVLFQGYYLLLPDKSAWPCEITGFSE